MSINIVIFPLKESLIPDHIRITKSLFGETGTVTFTFSKLSLIKERKNKMNLFLQLEIHTDKYIYSTKDINLTWANGKPYRLEAIFIFPNKKVFDYFFSELKSYASINGFSFLSK